MHQIAIKNGETGTAIPQSTQDYIAREANGTTIYLPASNTVYASTGGGGAQTTTYTYTFYTVGMTDTLKTESQTTTTAAGDVTTVFYDEFGRPTWRKDPEGYISYSAYNQRTGALIKTITDVDTTLVLDEPYGWTTPGGGGLHLVTKFTVDALGRTTRLIDANNNVTFTVYNDVNHEVRVYSGFTPTSETTGTITGPAIVVREDRAQGYTEMLTMSATPTVATVLGVTKPLGTEAISSLQSLSRTFFTTAWQAVESLAYFSFDEMSYSTSTSLGSLGDNFYISTFIFGDYGRAIKSVRGDGTISRTVHDSLGRVVSQWIGLDDLPDTGDWSPTNTAGTDLIKVTEYEYDEGGVGDGFLTSVTDALDRVTTFGYDFRGRQTSVTLPDPDGPGGGNPLTSPVSYTAYDNLGRITSTTDALSNVTTYEYDIVNHETTVTLPDPDGSGGGNPLTSPVIVTVTDGRGLTISQTDAMERTTTFAYDGAGRLVSTTLPDPDGGSGVSAAVMLYEYDNVGNLRFTTDPLENVTEQVYDKINRLFQVILPDPDDEGELEAPVTEYAYDLGGRMLSLTDPVGNVTSWEYDALGRMTLETNEFTETRSFQYDAAGHLIEKTDRLERVTQYEYNVFDQLIEERWYDDEETLLRTLTWNYDDAGQLQEVSDPSATYAYDYDNLGRVTLFTQTIDGLTFDIEYESQYNAVGSREDLLALIDGTADFHNTYAYDNLHRLTSLVQESPGGGHTIAEKRIDFGYNAASQFDSITRYADAAGTEFVVNTFYAYDGAVRLSYLLHTEDADRPVDIEMDWEGALAGYLYAYDVGSRMLSIDSFTDGFSEYEYDQTNQLTGADHSSQSDEEYSYDENGNRTDGDFEADPNNQLATDGTYTYTYDAEGNRETRTKISNGYVTVYQWDHHNRLAAVIEQDDLDGVLSSVEFAYDLFNRRVAKLVDSDGEGGSDPAETYFSWEHDQIILQFSGDDDSDLSHRYLYGPSVDQILTDETVTSLASAGSVLWPLPDHLGTLRDLATHNSTTHETDIANHRVFDSFGNIESESNSAIDHLFAFTARELDAETGLQYHRARYYDPAVSRWMGEDPIGFAGNDTNLNRYVLNNVITLVDSSGFEAEFAPPDDGQDPTALPYVSPFLCGDPRDAEARLKILDELESDAHEAVSNSQILHNEAMFAMLGAEAALGAWQLLQGLPNNAIPDAFAGLMSVAKAAVAQGDAAKGGYDKDTELYYNGVAAMRDATSKYRLTRDLYEAGAFMESYDHSFDPASGFATAMGYYASASRWYLQAKTAFKAAEALFNPPVVG